MKKLASLIFLVLAITCSGAYAQTTFLLFDEDGDDENNVTVTADSTRYSTKDYQSVFIGNVRITQADVVLTSDMVTVVFVPDGSREVESLELVGNVYMENATSRAYADQGIYESSNNQLTLTGNVRYFQEQMEAAGDVFRYNTETGDGYLESGIAINIQDS